MIQKKWAFFKRKQYKNNKASTCFLKSFNPELQFKDTESAIKSKLIELLTPLKGFKLVSTLVLVFKKRESDTFFSSLKSEIIISKTDIDDVF